MKINLTVIISDPEGDPDSIADYLYTVLYDAMLHYQSPYYRSVKSKFDFSAFDVDATVGND